MKYVLFMLPKIERWTIGYMDQIFNSMVRLSNPKFFNYQ